MIKFIIALIAMSTYNSRWNQIYIVETKSDTTVVKQDTVISNYYYLTRR